MLGADEEANSPEGGGVSSSSSTPSHFSPPPHDMIIDQNLLQNGAFDLSCPESFTQILEQIEEEQGQELVNSDACSTNCAGNIERKRHRTPTEEEEEEINNDIVEAVSETNVDPQRYYALFGLNTSTDDDEEEGINNAIVEAVSEIRRTNPDPYSPRRYYALFGLNTFTDDEAEEGHQQNERGEEFGNQDSEQQESEKKENLESEPNEGKEDRNQENKSDKEEETEKEEEKEEEEEEKEEETEKEEEEEENEELQEEETENAGDTEHNRNHQNSEQQENGDHNDNQDTEQQENENQESEQDNEEAGENDENQEENDNEEEEETEVDEEEKRKADEKGKRPMSEICQLKFIPPKFFKFEKGGPSDTPEGDQTQENDNHDQLNNEDDDEDEDLQVLAILKSIWHFKCNNGYFPYPTSDELHNHIMDSVPNLKILGEDLTNKIIALEDNFYTVRALDGDNPDTDRPIHREIFNWSMRLWGNSEDQNGNVEQQNQELYDVNIVQNSTANDLEGWSWW